MARHQIATSSSLVHEQHLVGHLSLLLLTKPLFTVLRLRSIVNREPPTSATKATPPENQFNDLLQRTEKSPRPNPLKLSTPL